MSGAQLDNMARARRMQSLVDAFVSVFISMVLWPFPIARATLTPLAQVLGILGLCAVAHFAYLAVSCAFWGRTLGMRLAGIELMAAEDAPVHRSDRARWGLAAAAGTALYALAAGSVAARSWGQTRGVRVELR